LPRYVLPISGKFATLLATRGNTKHMNTTHEDPAKHSQQATGSVRLLVRVSAKKHALRCSTARRAGKFTRVGNDFLDAVEASLLAELSRIKNERWMVYPFDQVGYPETGGTLLTPAFVKRASAILNDLAAKIIQVKVQKHPSLGSTLKA
jgi:hypothetical protein